MTYVADIDECALLDVSDDCLNGGSCVNTVGSFMCECSEGFTDSQCQTGRLFLHLRLQCLTNI